MREMSHVFDGRRNLTLEFFSWVYNLVSVFRSLSSAISNLRFLLSKARTRRSDDWSYRLKPRLKNAHLFPVSDPRVTSPALQFACYFHAIVQGQ